MMEEIIENKPEESKIKEEISKPLEPDRSKGFYKKNYKKLLIIPLLLLIFSLIYLGFFYSKNHDIIYKDITLTGGTILTINTEEKVNTIDLENFLLKKTSDVIVRTIRDPYTKKQIAISIETTLDSEKLKSLVENYGIHLKEGMYSVEITGSGLSKSFYAELIRALIIAFAFMAIVVFIIFKIPIPSLAVILSAIMDIVITLSIIDFLGLRISTAGIAAFLMLIGYSVDTDIMLTTKLIKRKENVLDERLKNALKTGLTMTLTSIAAMLTAYIVLVSPVLKQVFLILVIGLCVDLSSTWLANASILRWYCEKKHIE